MNVEQMSALQLAREFAGQGNGKAACDAYTVAMAGPQPLAPEEELEAALYVLQAGGDYRAPYLSLKKLYQTGHFQEEALGIIREAFYAPNEKAQRTRYEKNCSLLRKYPYIFRRDFPSFESLPVEFFPFDDDSFFPFEKGCIGDVIQLEEPVVGRNFFKDLDRPILAQDVFSQYELEYLNDMVRPSEWVGRENHIYLHYTSWERFCSYLKCLNLRKLLSDKKTVFLFEEEVERYPIDFKREFGIDYSQYPVKRVGIREINKIIWHTQLSSHNGGDFFNEVMDSHPNLITVTSIMFDTIKDFIRDVKKVFQEGGDFALYKSETPLEKSQDWIFQELRTLKNRTDKDILVAYYLCLGEHDMLDKGSRIAPAIFFQPHFHKINYTLSGDERGWTTLDSKQYRAIMEFAALRGFKYIKTFTPMRRMTSSYGGTVKFMLKSADERNQAREKEDDTIWYVADCVLDRLLNRSFMIDKQERLFKDSILVRFEDGKLNPTATFTALAAFLDIPYAETMKYCSEDGVLNPHPDTKGFDTSSVYRTYDDYVDFDAEYFIEYFARDVYQFYGYDFQFYDGKPVDMARCEELVKGFTKLDGFMRDTRRLFVEKNVREDQPVVQEMRQSEEWKDRPLEDIQEEALRADMELTHAHRLQVAEILMRNLRFVNKNGQRLYMMPQLQLDPELLEQPLYH